MAKVDKDEVERRLAELRHSYLQELPSKLAVIGKLWLQLCDTWEPELAKKLHHACHTLAGSGATFGLPDLSRSARAMEHFLKNLNDKGRVPTPPEYSQMQESCDALLNGGLSGLNSVDGISSVGIPHSKSEHDSSRLVYLVEDDVSTASEIGMKLTAAGFLTRTFHTLESFEQAYTNRWPDAIIMDIVFPEDDVGGVHILQKLHSKYLDLPPIIMISMRSDIQSRLGAVHAGAARYFTKPLNLEKFISTLDGLTTRVPREAYRVLIIDDDKTLVQYHATILHQAGMRTMIIDDPLKCLEALSEFSPDLVLMDVYMPECSGLELASVIRQDDSFAQMPIVFLSTEHDLGKQLYAMNLGGDDFLTKPVEPGHLVAAVTARVNRSRWLYRLQQELHVALSENEEHRRELAVKEERLKRSQIFANIGTWDWDIVSGVLVWSERIAPLFGYPNGELETTYDNFLNAIHPDDRRMVVDAVNNCVQHSAVYDIEHRVVWPDGTVRWLSEKGNVVRDSNGKPLRMLGVVQDIHQRKLLEENLEEQKDLANQANRAKSEFLSRMSHELRTPMNAILGFSQLLLTDDESPLSESQTDNIHEVMRAGEHLLELINEVLDLARIEAGKMVLNLVEVELLPILKHALHLVSPMATSRNITVTTEIRCSGTVYVMADRTRLRQVLLNLLSNAIKYNKPSGQVSLTCVLTEDGETVRMSVIDTGPGLSPEQQVQLFQSFNRLEAEQSNVQGTGIGLVITKRLVELMRGQIGVESEIDKGSCFWFDLPRVHPAEL